MPRPTLPEEQPFLRSAAEIALERSKDDADAAIRRTTKLVGSHEVFEKRGWQEDRDLTKRILDNLEVRGYIRLVRRPYAGGWDFRVTKEGFKAVGL